MSTEKTLQDFLSADELTTLLQEAVHFHAIFQRPDIIREVLKGDGTSEQIEKYIESERFRLSLVYAEKVGALVGVVNVSDLLPTMGNA